MARRVGEKYGRRDGGKILKYIGLLEIGTCTDRPSYDREGGGGNRVSKQRLIATQLLGSLAFALSGDLFLLDTSRELCVDYTGDACA